MKKIILFAASCIMLAACAKTETEGNIQAGEAFGKGQRVTLTLSAPSETKVTSTADDTDYTVNFKWKQDDTIKVIVGGSWAVFKVSELLEDDTKAIFTGEMPAEGESFDLQYPVKDPDISVQAYSSEEALPHDKMKFTATNCSLGDTSIELKAANAALRLLLYADDICVSRIVITNITAADPKPSYTLNCEGGKTLSSSEETPSSFFFVVPAGEWKFKAEIYNNASTPELIATLVPSKAQTFTAGEVLIMNPPKRAGTGDDPIKAR